MNNNNFDASFIVLDSDVVAKAANKMIAWIKTKRSEEIEAYFNYYKAIYIVEGQSFWWRLWHKKEDIDPRVNQNPPDEEVWAYIKRPNKYGMCIANNTFCLINATYSDIEQVALDLLSASKVSKQMYVSARHWRMISV